MAITRIQSPLNEATIRALRAGERVLLSGLVVTARDLAHKYLAAGQPAPLDLRGMVIYHCGPVVIGGPERWRITAAGPTTSMREEPYQADVIERFHPGAVMGKGGMGAKTLETMHQTGCVYLHVTGGAAQYLARCIKAVQAVYFLEEFGQPEAMWVLEVADLPALVTMDSQGASFHAGRQELTQVNFARLLGLSPKP